MSVSFNLVAPTGGNFVVTLERLSDGFFWNDVAAAFQAAPTFANKKIVMAEGTSENLGSYTASRANLGSPLRIRIRFHDDDDASDITQAFDCISVFGGDEVDNELLRVALVGASQAGVVDDAGATATVFKGDSGLSATDDFYNDALVGFLDGSPAAGRYARVTDYVGATRTFTVAPALAAAPSDTDGFRIFGINQAVT